MKRKIYTDGNGSSLIMVEGLGEYVPKSEFVKIKAELEQHDDQITNIEEANKEISDVANDKILELKTMVESIADYIYNMEAKRGETILFRQKALNFIDELREQK